MFQYTHIGLTGDPEIVKVWARSLPDDETKDHDPYNLGRWCYALYSHWMFHLTAKFSAGNEAEIRSGSDYLFQLAFQLQSGWKHRVR